ncbi:hypothetical protein Lesp02_35910 [Lentzea sp. NBRC 105346]|uniref:hypothetical protein n=1 Tax=Lentzea sp. NBRC 105346 TaxID=3032205 RepID=UPI0024A1DD99|nr:hypothetical protein [Lentzea sp. NBRC 105346]GLZ31403.1 hypothetical protein Lesp02_35910 [Lentzea sp. NBRC 105346]
MRTPRLIAALSAVALSFVTVPAASADPTVSCTGGAIKSQFTPGLTYQPRTQSVRTDAYSYCTGSRISRATVTLNTSGTGQCAPMGVPEGSGSGVIKWSDGSSSQFDATVSIMLTGSDIAGEITSGRFAGQQVEIRGGQDSELGDAVTACYTGSLRVLSSEVEHLTVG